MCGLAPAPSAGGVPSYTSKKRRNRPTVTSKSSRRNVLTVTGCSGSSLAKPVVVVSVPPSTVPRPIMKDPPRTDDDLQQLTPAHSFPVIPAHDARPLPEYAESSRAASCKPESGTLDVPSALASMLASPGLPDAPL